MRILTMCFLCVVLAQTGCSSNSSGGQQTGDADGTDGSVGIDGTDGTTGADGSDGTDGTDGTQPTGCLPAAGADTLVNLGSVSFKALLKQTGAMSATADTIYVCDGNSVAKIDACKMNSEPLGDLAAACTTTGATGSTVVATSEDGKWHNVTSKKSVAGPTARALAVNATHMVAALGKSGLAVAPLTFDAPAVTHPVAGDARDLMWIGDRLLVANGLKGILSFSLDASGVPSQAAQFTDFEGSALGLGRVSDTRAMVALGGGGLLMIDVSAAAITKVGHLDISLETNGAATWANDVAVGADGTALVADWLDARLIDITNPSAMKVLARERFVARGGKHNRAMSVAYTPNGYIVQGLDHITRLGAYKDVVAAEITMETSSLPATATSEATQVAFLIPNTGRDALRIKSVTTNDSRVSVADGSFGTDTIEKGSDFLVIGAGDTGYIPLDITAGDTQTVMLTMETNDPDYPKYELPISINAPVAKVGEAAKDFMLPGIHGEMTGPDELKGTVLYLKLFNSQ